MEKRYEYENGVRIDWEWIDAAGRSQCETNTRCSSQKKFSSIAQWSTGREDWPRTVGLFVGEHAEPTS